MLAAGASFVFSVLLCWWGIAFVEALVVVAACVSVFVVLFILDCVDLVSVVAFNVVFRAVAVKVILKEEGFNRLASSAFAGWGCRWFIFTYVSPVMLLCAGWVALLLIV